MIRFGLCCIFKNEPIRFRRATARFLMGMPRTQQLEHLSRLCYHNALALQEALAFCRRNAIGSFRINSQIMPLRTHPDVGYRVVQLPKHERLIERLKACGAYAGRHDIRTTFHPDQFVVLNSPNPAVLEHSIAELEYQAEVAQWVHADVINLHAGGAYGDKRGSLERLRRRIDRLSDPVRSRLTIENDDVLYAPSDILPLCEQAGIPCVYDVHHHRCLPDALSVEEATERTLKTWDREPLFHLASPKGAWSAKKIFRMHADYIDPGDFPGCWNGLTVTVEIEAKAKECAVVQVVRQLSGRSD